MGNRDAAIDRLSQCRDKLFCLSCLNMQLVGGGDDSREGLSFLLSDVAYELKGIEEEFWAEIRSEKAQAEPPKG